MHHSNYLLQHYNSSSSSSSSTHSPGGGAGILNSSKLPGPHWLSPTSLPNTGLLHPSIVTLAGLGKLLGMNSGGGLLAWGLLIGIPSLLCDFGVVVVLLAHLCVFGVVVALLSRLWLFGVLAALLVNIGSFFTLDFCGVTLGDICVGSTVVAWLMWLECVGGRS
jgi:hypothetical protein